MTIRSGVQGALALFLCGLVSGCVRPLLDPSRMSAMQIRAIQTRTYEGQPPQATLKTVLNVLQDEGYLVDYGNVELGLLHGTKNIDELAAQQFGEAPVRLYHPFYQDANFYGATLNVITLEATANVSDFGNQTRVRINFQRKLANSRQGLLEAMPVVEARFYQEFFAKLERGLFLQKEGL